jgi:phospholipase A-2-activating protein
MPPFKLSASLSGHDDDVSGPYCAPMSGANVHKVRGVSFPNPGTVVSASRDASVRLWTLKNKLPPVFDQSILSHTSSFINAVAFVPPSSAYPDGLVVSGSREGLIEARSPSKRAEDDAEAVLIGHANNICALHVSEDGTLIVSGSWDTTARIWQIGKWSTEDSVVLQGHEASVWGVLAYSNDLIITGESKSSFY